MPDNLERATLRKISWRLGALLFFVYVLNYLDRTNISIAKIEMQPDIALSEAAFGLGAGLFFIGYVLFEVPSNMILYRVGARYWIARIMFTWGLVSMAMFLVRDEWSFYGLRFLLGVAEAGLVPGVLLYLSQWVPAAHRARLIGVFYVAVPISTVIGAPLSTWLMGFTPWGLTGWQFMFLVEGFPCLLMAFVVLRYLTDKPSQATWLTEQQRTWLTTELAREDAANGSAGHRAASFRAVVKDKRVLGMSFAFFSMIIPLYAMAFFLPTIVKQLGTFTTTQIGWLTAIPYVFAALGMWLLARHSDRTGERTRHYVWPATAGVAGLVVSALNLTGSPVLALAGFTLAAIGCISTLPVFWAQAPYLLAGAAAATGIAFITAIGNIAGFVSPYMVALIKGNGPGLGNSAAAILVTAVFLAVAAGTMAAVGHRIGRRRTREPEPARESSPAP
ncbi:MFS transporter [Amycolatopsis tolypomycina]|uniref:Sugar phosphate permease n=1 Tax=Amycolatopsis tolypomycina TaxID=208445 RepID=A0A1H4TSH6_9PSEU|nr:MFS transporter [Amycolatopsis tolypomycina]SEC59453.1 Sugar phosphate permease [Amycolatopsis tolypomycina]